MQRFRLLLVLVLLAQARSGHAQRFGDGTLLRRMLGAQPPVAAQEYEKQRLEAQRKEALQKQASPDAAALERQSSWPPATTSQRARQPQGYGTLGDSERPAAAYRSPTSSRRTGEPTPATRSNPPSDRGKEQTPLERSLEHDGFGITLTMSGQNVVVSQVRKSGTGAKAGLQQGDILKSIAALPITTPADVRQFNEVLKPGDQVEFEVARRGQDEQLMVSFMRGWNPESETQPINDDNGKTQLPASTGLFSRTSEQVKRSLTSLSEPRLPFRAAESPSEVSEAEKLREVIRLQSQLIEDLQNRLRSLEKNQGQFEPAVSFPQ